jgi:hypothetical protein
VLVPSSNPTPLGDFVFLRMKKMSDYSAKPVRAPEVVMDDPNKKLQEVLDYLKYSYVKSSGYKGTVRARAFSRSARSALTLTSTTPRAGRV